MTNACTLFKALSDPARLHILKVIQEQEGDTTALFLWAQLRRDNIYIEQSTLSHHIRILQEAGIVGYHLQGHFHHYFICPGILEQACALLISYLGKKSEVAS